MAEGEDEVDVRGVEQGKGDAETGHNDEETKVNEGGGKTKGETMAEGVPVEKEEKPRRRLLSTGGRVRAKSSKPSNANLSSSMIDVGMQRSPGNRLQQIRGVERKNSVQFSPTLRRRRPGRSVLERRTFTLGHQDRGRNVSGSNINPDDLRVVMESRDQVERARRNTRSGVFFELPAIPLYADIVRKRQDEGADGKDGVGSLKSKAPFAVDKDGRLDLDAVEIQDDDFIPHRFPRRLTKALPPTKPRVPPADIRPPCLSVAILLTGSRGDVQPFLALGKELQKYGHRVRICTHDMFRDFVVSNGFEFFPLGGDPRALMEHMIKNPGIMPGSMKEIQASRANMENIVFGSWNAVSCPESVVTTIAEETAGIEKESPPWHTDAIISNPPTYGHYHVAERLGVPLHLYFTMPWSPTNQFPHPLSNMSYAKRTARRNLFSYYMVETLTWTGLGDLVNSLRTKKLGLPAVPSTAGHTLINYAHVPFAYIWSPSLIPKPLDWGTHIDITGFFFLDLGLDYQPPPALRAFLDAGDPPIYVGFGSIVLDDPVAMTTMIYQAFEETGYRGIVSRGWSGLGDGMETPENIFLIDDCPHDWLFRQVAAVCHHGGAGTAAAGLRAGRPTMICPFFGDQPFWGNMVAERKVGPAPVKASELTVEALVNAFRHLMQPKTRKLAKELGEKMCEEKGIKRGVEVFHAHLPLKFMRCDVEPNRPAVIFCYDCDMVLSAEVHGVVHSQSMDHRWFRYGCIDLNPQRFVPGPHHVISGITGGILESFMLVPQLVLEPWNGLRSEGLSGLLKGLLKGIRGVFVYPYRGIIIFIRELHSGIYTPSWDGEEEKFKYGRYILLSKETEDASEWRGQWVELSTYMDRIQDMADQGLDLRKTKLPGHSGNAKVDMVAELPLERRDAIEKLLTKARESRQTGRKALWEEKEEREINWGVAFCLTIVGIILGSAVYLLLFTQAMSSVEAVLSDFGDALNDVVDGTVADHT